VELRSVEAIEDDFDESNKKFSYTSLKELAAKVPEYLLKQTKSRHALKHDG